MTSNNYGINIKIYFFSIRFYKVNDDLLRHGWCLSPQGQGVGVVMALSSSGSSTGSSKQAQVNSSSENIVAPACQICGKMFRSFWHLTRHFRTHTGERPYSCPFCSYAATQSGDLKRHFLALHSVPSK